MTSLPARTEKKLGLVIDLDICVGCHACAVACKEWNTGGYGAALSDQDAYGAEPSGTWLNRIHSFEVQPVDGPAQIIHFPKSWVKPRFNRPFPEQSAAKSMNGTDETFRYLTHSFLQVLPFRPCIRPGKFLL